MKKSWTLPADLYHLSQRHLVDEARAIIRHELRNRLATLRNGTYVLRRRISAPEGPGDLDQLLGVLENQVAAAFEVLEAQNCEEAAPDGGAQESAPLEVASDLVTTLNARERVILPSEPADPVAVPGLELGLALFCLLENALEAGPGQVTLEVIPRGDALALQLTNTLPDAPEEPQRWQEPFYSTKPGRPGLGLAVARRIAIRHSGSVELEVLEPDRVRAALVFPRGQAS